MKKRGISLITLIIIIVVILILAAAIIINLNKTKIIDNANKAVQLNNEKVILEEMNLAYLDFFAANSKAGISLEKFKNYLLEKKPGIRVTSEENGIVKFDYKGYEVQVDDQLNISVSKGTDIVNSTKVDPQDYTNGTVDINMNIELKDGSTVVSITPLTQGVEVVEENSKFRVTKNGDYEFEVVTSSGVRKTVVVSVKNIDDQKPQISNQNIPTECTQNAYVNISYEITDDNEIDLAKCKYIIDTNGTKYEADNAIWETATPVETGAKVESHEVTEVASLTNNIILANSNDVGNKTISFDYQFTQPGKYYMHILVTDVAGNCDTYISDAITVKKEPLYLFNEGPVSGYTWTRSHQAAGNTSKITNGAIYFIGNNSTWVGAEWELKNVNLSGYTQIHMEVTTGTKVTVEDGYGIGITADHYTNKPIMSTLTNNLSRQVISGNLGSYSKSGTTLYLIFSRWKTACYVHKIWVD